MTINIKDVVVTMTDAQKRTLQEDRKRLVGLAIQLQAATDAFNEQAKEVANVFKEFGITPTGLKTFAKAKAKDDVAGAINKLEASVEELQFLEGDE